MSDCIPVSEAQFQTLDIIRDTYGNTHIDRYPTLKDPTLHATAEFWGDSYSGYEIEVTINVDGTIKKGE